MITSASPLESKTALNVPSAASGGDGCTEGCRAWLAGSVVSRGTVLFVCFIVLSTSGPARSINRTEVRDQSLPRIPLHGEEHPSSGFVGRGSTRDACFTHCISLTNWQGQTKSLVISMLKENSGRKDMARFPLRYERRRRLPCLGMPRKKRETCFVNVAAL